MKNTIKPEMTVEAKARFFALYWGQIVLSNGVELGGCVGDCDDDLFLELTPLSDITDEDAIEVASICEYNRLRPDIVTIGKAIAFEKAYSGSISKMTAIIDFLRSRGYSLPFRNYSVSQLQDFGWLKLKQKGGYDGNV